MPVGSDTREKNGVARSKDCCLCWIVVGGQRVCVAGSRCRYEGEEGKGLRIGLAGEVKLTKREKAEGLAGCGFSGGTALDCCNSHWCVLVGELTPLVLAAPWKVKRLSAEGKNQTKPATGSRGESPFAAVTDREASVGSQWAPCGVYVKMAVATDSDGRCPDCMAGMRYIGTWGANKCECALPCR